METTAAALARIATALDRGTIGIGVDIAQVLGVLASLLAVIVASAALRGERVFRSSDSLVKLVEYFDANGFFVRMWRLNQVMRKLHPGSMVPVPLRDLTKHANPVVASLANEAFATDWAKTRADMYGLYFFALRVHAWLVAKDGMRIDKKTRMLNDTFGHQLLGTLVSHWVIACRVRNPGSKVGLDYYPTHYGLFDPDYQDLVARLSDDLFSDGRGLMPAVKEPMKQSLLDVREHISALSPTVEAAELPPAERAS